MKYVTHPEVHDAIVAEVTRLAAKHPTLSFYKRMDLATKMIRTLCDANTNVFYAENMSIKR